MSDLPLCWALFPQLWSQGSQDYIDDEDCHSVVPFTGQGLWARPRKHVPSLNRIQFSQEHCSWPGIAGVGSWPCYRGGVQWWGWTQVPLTFWPVRVKAGDTWRLGLLVLSWGDCP